MSIAATPQTLRQIIHPLTGAPDAYDPLFRLIGESHFVLLGEASHGTHEFYRERAAITRRLIEECGFDAVAVEADWPDAYRVNRYVRGEGPDGTAEQALGDFKRFPQWMWRNSDVLDFVSWLRAYNDSLPPQRPKVGFYGLDLYSPRFLMTLRDKAGIEELTEQRLERAIGVVYRPETERRSHYFFSRLAQQFDAVIHFDDTRAVEPLEKTGLWERGELPETYPSGL
jgi:erythromycin esterase-like protein